MYATSGPRTSGSPLATRVFEIKSRAVPQVKRSVQPGHNSRQAPLMPWKLWVKAATSSSFFFPQFARSPVELVVLHGDVLVAQLVGASRRRPSLPAQLRQSCTSPLAAPGTSRPALCTPWRTALRDLDQLCLAVYGTLAPQRLSRVSRNDDVKPTLATYCRSPAATVDEADVLGMGDLALPAVLRPQTRCWTARFEHAVLARISNVPPTAQFESRWSSWCSRVAQSRLFGQ